MFDRSTGLVFGVVWAAGGVVWAAGRCCLAATLLAFDVVPSEGRHMGREPVTE